jgi:ubiquinone/menaquinone biosynthesis C-methylase UbiE
MVDKEVLADSAYFEKLIENIYTPKYFGPVEGQQIISGDQPDYALNLLKFFDEPVETILDVGCSWGWLVRELRALGKKVYGVDLSAFSLIRVVNSFVKQFLIAGNLVYLPFKDSSFDVVHYKDALEHIPFCFLRTAIEESIRVSKKYIVFMLPLVKTSEEEKAVSTESFEEHYISLTWQSWERIFSEFGWERIDVRKRSRISDHDGCFMYKINKDYEI